MKKLILSIALLPCILAQNAMAVATNWKKVDQNAAPSTALMPFKPNNFNVFSVNEAELKNQLFLLSTDPSQSSTISLPLPDGTLREFRVWEAPMMEDGLAKKYPDIKTFTAVAVDDKSVTAKLDFTLFGFHAMIFDGTNTSFINPYDKLNDGLYFAQYRKDEVRLPGQTMKCERHVEDTKIIDQPVDYIQLKSNKTTAARTANGWTLRTYRLALSANSYYCQAATGLGSPTIAQCLSAMTTSMNRINGVYEREFSVHMNFCSNEDTLIWPTATGSVNGTDPFRSINNNGSACLSANQTQCDRRIGSANYDLGHVFTTGGGGVSLLGVVCSSGNKASSCTGSPTPTGDGYDIDYVAHEMGHEFGSEHTFNNNMDGSCGSNAVNTYAYEPGSGSTIMDYAGICDPDDVQLHSDAYFSLSSVSQITNQLVRTETTCAVTSATNNKLVNVASFTTSYTIPYKTPFELTAPTAVDSVADTSITYCWAQNDLGDFGKRIVQTFLRGPIFRSFTPSKSPTRVFPQMSMVLAGNLSNAGTEGAQGEKAPDTARTLTFKCTFRDIFAGHGCILIPDDVVTLTAVQTSTKAGFKVTSQGTTGISYTGGSTQTITWNVVGTNAAPVSAANVQIYLSTNGGTSWGTLLGTFPNTGSATVTMPNPAATISRTRIKVKGANNVFFNVNSQNFTLTHNTALPVTGVSELNDKLADNVSIYPVPAHEHLSIEAKNGSSLNCVIYNSVGQTIWQNNVEGTVNVPVNNWATGVYYVRITDAQSGQQIVKSVLIN